MPVLQRRLVYRGILFAALAGCGPSTPPPAAASDPEPRATPTATLPAATASDTSAAAPPKARDEQAPAAAASSKPDLPPPGSPLDRIMRAHFADALLIRKAVIEGRPERAAAPAKVFSEIADLDQLPRGWQGFVQRMQDAARRIVYSTSAEQAASATADLGVSCGMCHEEHGGPKVVNEPPPPEATSVEGRMKRHVWATDRLWEGLYVPSSDAWSTGVKALSSEPFPNELMKTGGVHLRSAATEFKKLVLQAPTRKTLDERASLYAAMLVRCGACHQAVSARD